MTLQSAFIPIVNLLFLWQLKSKSPHSAVNTRGHDTRKVVLRAE